MPVTTINVRDLTATQLSQDMKRVVAESRIRIAFDQSG
jgi:hypothetical protein